LKNIQTGLEHMKQINDTTAIKITDYNTAASGGNSKISITGSVGNRITFEMLSWSYAAAPTGGAISIVDNTASNTVKGSWDITAAGPGQLVFPDGFQCGVGNTISVVLVDGGQTKKLTISYK
jgi:hypothetical protein